MKIITLFLSIAVTESSRENKQTTGVGLYVNQAYQFKERDDLAIKVDDVIELHFIELRAIPNYEYEYIGTADERLNRRKILAVCAQL